jgi:hypothetical protein
LLSFNVVEIIENLRWSIMTTMEIPAWAKEFEVVTEDQDTTTTVNEEFEKLLGEAAGGSFVEGEVYQR